MSAYFDGDGADDFCLPSSSESNDELNASSIPQNNKASPIMLQLVSPCFVACSIISSASQSPSFNLSEAPAKSALRTAARRGGRRVTWSDEAKDKSSIKLVDLIETPITSTSPLARHVWHLSQDAQGTFEVQKELEKCSSDAQRSALAAELRGHVLEATRCPHANHVLRKIITTMPPASLTFVIVELMSQGPRGITEIARTRYGCRILEALLDQCPFEELCGMAECLASEAAVLSTHMYGNFVIQRLLDRSTFALRMQLFQMVQANLVMLGTNFYGSAVLGKAVMSGTDMEKLALSHAILDVNGLLAAIARYRHGKAIVETVMMALDGTKNDAALSQLASPPLKVPKSGRCC
jgi:hypothetical protein